MGIICVKFHGFIFNTFDVITEVSLKGVSKNAKKFFWYECQDHQDSCMIFIFQQVLKLNTMQL